MNPISPQRKWRAIAIATLLLVVAFWAMLSGAVTDASDDAGGVENPGVMIAFGFALIPFVFLALAFLSEHPAAPSATLRAMGLCLAVGIPVAAVTVDAVTGIVAGVGAGGVVALRRDDGHTWQARAIAVGIGAAYAFVLARTAGSIVLLPAPIFPFTAIGVADHLSERRLQQSRT